MKPAIVTVGNFDGVHLGHQMLLHQVVDRARALSLRSFAVTFDPHPEQVLFPERKLTQLSTSSERCELMCDCGIDEVWVCPFTSELSRLEPEDFIRLVIERQPIGELWVGADFAMGRGRRGTIGVLAEIGTHLGWGLHMVPPYRLEDQVVSSTAIRTLLGAGAVRGAADLLGRNYSVPGALSSDSVLCADALRALPRPGLTYETQVHQHGHIVVCRAQVLGEGRIQLIDAQGTQPGEATLEFTRRLD
ncbi:MAG: FAD synthetase family protein [Chloroflexi bacterium]|nr:FAD synthetase family protein [Chloroflexota bacterium]